MTVASLIAARYWNDGTKLVDGAGAHIDDELKIISVTSEERAPFAIDEDDPPSEVRYEFCDGSAIVRAGDYWDVEGPEKFSWESIAGPKAIERD